MPNDVNVLDCDRVLPSLHALRRGRLDAAQRDAVVHHLATCASCRAEDEADALLDRLLHERLPRDEAPAELRRALAAVVASPSDARPAQGVAPGSNRRARRRSDATWKVAKGLGALAAAAALVVCGALWERAALARRGDVSRLAEEAVGDHLRLLAAAHPYDLESSASHEVKPWFEGKLDFAPNVPHDVGGLVLRGGSVGYFLDRKAAVISYTLRRHVVTLLALPALGLPWPDAGARSDGIAAQVTVRGVHVFFWRHGDVAYALVADVGPSELRRVADDLARATAD